MRNDGQLLFNQSAVEDESINDAPHATSMIYWIVVAFDESKPRSIDGTRLLIGCSFVPFDRLDWVFGDRRTERDDSDVCFVLLFEKLRAKLATFLYCLYFFRNSIRSAADRTGSSRTRPPGVGAGRSVVGADAGSDVGVGVGVGSSDDARQRLSAAVGAQHQRGLAGERRLQQHVLGQ